MADLDPHHLNQLVLAIAQSSTTASDTSASGSTQILSSTAATGSLALESENLEQLGPIIRQVTETGKQDAFLDHLDTFIRKKETDIERMCNNNYQEFVQSVDQLLKVRQGTIKLKDKIVGLNTEIHKTGSRLAAKKKELIETRRTQQNIDQAIETLQTSLLVLELANKVNTHMENQKYYSALKTLDELQSQHLRHVMQFEFSTYLSNSIPVMQSMIKDAVTNEMKEWLVKVRETSRVIGAMAMTHMQDRQDRWRAKTAEDPKLKSVQHHNVNSAIEQVVNEADETNILDDVNIDFQPLFRCLHIYDSLGRRQEFKSSYEEDRRAQANLALSSPLNLRDGNILGFETLLQDIVGFFIIEHVVMHSTVDFRSQNEVDALWEMVTDKVIQVMYDGLKGCKDTELFLKIKFNLLIFIQTLEGFGYPVKNLQETLLVLFQRYSELLIGQYSEVFVKIVQEDECMPMTVDNEDDIFPRTLPFSKVFPTCCRDVSIFVHQFYQFAEGFSQTHGEMDDILKKAVDNLLIQKVNAILLKKLESLNLSQIVQIIINIEYFENACDGFEHLLMDSRSFHRAGKIILKATNVFRETRKKGEKRIFELVNMKIDEFLELADYDWMSEERNKNPSPYLQDLVTFLDSVINATLLNLPQSIKSFIYFDALDHLATAIKGILINPGIKKMNDNAVYNFDLDIQFLEDFVQGLGDPNVADAFLELRQMILLIEADSSEDFLNPQVRNRKFARLKSQDVIVVMEKLLNDKSVNNLLNQREKLRRRAMENSAYYNVV
ncbi:exocyst complex subunit Sec15-like-domain-containing protein [Endogone sp. FLAS-F59071]|nr:exocyst complex subunit Sec15-like-domain-containing protein [Endogone sp. FLAS-F59071]|eukprot:RUS18641.1 exocyst complex subunit Sec15-like-domain-containing protein [Endogone sp. FLAS-F59071]